MAKDIECSATVNNPDGSLFYREEHEWTNCDEQMEQAITDMLEKQLAFIEKEKANEKGKPDAMFSATLTATGMPDAHFDSFSYNLVQKSAHNWNQLGETLLRMGEKRIKKG
jgi:chloramphenicol O-acetyltransferase